MSTILQQILGKGKDIGGKKGEEAGIREAVEMFKLDVALKCFIEGIDVQTIARITGLPVERIEILKHCKQPEKNVSCQAKHPKKELTIGIKTAKVVLKPITAREYYNFYQKTIAISTDWYFHITLDYKLSIEAPEFSLAHYYAALKTLFGESTTMFDDYKCSFGYTFLLEVLILRKYRYLRKNGWIS